MVSTPRRILALCLAVPLLAAACGCRGPVLRNRSPLGPVKMSADAVVLEVFFVRFPFGDDEANCALWEEVDEQHMEPVVRQRLAENGFRVGVAAGQLPIALARLMELDNKPAPVAQPAQTDLADLAATPRVVRRHLQLRAGRPGEILASGVYESLPVLVRSGGELRGQTYPQAQAVFNVQATPQRDGRVRVELLPEIQHGQARQQWVGGQGTLMLEMSRPKRVLDDLAVAATLSPGGMLVMTSLPNRPGSLGHRFLTEQQGDTCQKLLLVRLAQTQHDGAFCPPEVLQLDEAGELPP
jgi:hypothetical protein